jgi:transposase
MATYIHELCQVMTIQEVSEHLGLDWKTIKEIDKVFLEADFGSPKLDGLRILAIDEIAIKKRFHYMTVVLDYQTGRIVWMGEGRSYDTLASFFQLMSPEQLLRLEAIALDMWDPYLKAIQEFTPHVKIVFDLYHVVAGFNKVIDAVRNLEYRKASQSQRKIFKGSKFLLLMNKHRIRSQKARQHLNRLLALNKTLAKLYILKEKLKTLWTYRLPYHAQKALNDWCRLARTIRYPLVRSFAKQLQRYSYGIINHCVYPINSAKIEGANNKIKVIKRKAYGFHDLRYFTLKAIQAFTH